MCSHCVIIAHMFVFATLFRCGLIMKMVRDGYVAYANALTITLFYQKQGAVQELLHR